MRGEPAIDPYDEESELATERELAFMWLADLEARVADLEELLKMPGCLASPPDLETRVGDLEALTAMLLPTVWARNQPQLALSWESAQTEGGSGLDGFQHPTSPGPRPAPAGSGHRPASSSTATRPLGQVRYRGEG